MRVFFVNIHLLLLRDVSVMRNFSLRVKYILYFAVFSGQNVGTQWEFKAKLSVY